MKEAVVHPDLKVDINDVPIPKPNAAQVLIKVVYSGSNPKDWKMPAMFQMTANHGDDIAGYVQSVGSDVTEFKPGDRVAAFHEMRTPNGSYAEYAISWAYTTFHIPKKTSFEEAATIPLAAMTAAVGLYQRLGLPEPWRATVNQLPILIYGGSSAVGAFAIKLCQVSNIHPMIVVAGSGAHFVEGLIDREKGDKIVDYRQGDESTVAGIKEALKKHGISDLQYAFDAVSEKGSSQNIWQVLGPNGKVTSVLPVKDVPSGVISSQTAVGSVHQDPAPDSDEAKAGIKTGGKDLGFAFFRWFGRALQEGIFSGHPHEVVPDGLAGVGLALKNLKEGKASAVKYVFKVGDTEGAGKD